MASPIQIMLTSQGEWSRMMKYLILLTILFTFIGCDNRQEAGVVMPDNAVKRPSVGVPKTPTPEDIDVEDIDVEDIDVEDIDVEDIDVEDIDVEDIDVEDVDVEDIDVEDIDVEDIDVEDIDVEDIDVEDIDVEDVDVEDIGNGDVPEGAENLDEAQLGALLVFGKNDRIIVKDTIKTLNIRESAAGPAIGGMRSGETGRILSEGEIEDGLVWFHIEWDAPVKNPLSGCGIGKKVCIGWSVAVLIPFLIEYFS